MSIGRGLNALLSATSARKKTIFETGDTNLPGRVWSVPVSEIVPNSQQPRRHFSEVELQELAGSIKEHGILQPLLVAEKTDGGYELIAGERRLRAAQLAGLATVPVIVKAAAESEKLELALIENIQRQDLNALEEAFAYQRLVEEFGLTQQQVAEKVGKSRPAVTNMIRLLELPEEIQQALVEEKINMGQARALLSIEKKEQQLELLASMLGQKITVRELERAAQAQPGRKPTLRKDPNIVYLENQLRAKLGSRVAISTKGERGTITIDYYSKEELKRLVELLGG